MKKLSFHTKALFISILYAALTSTDGVTICGGNGSSPDGCGVVNSAGLGFSIFLGITLPFIVIAAYLWIKQIRAGDQCSFALPRFGPEASRREHGPPVEVVRALEVPELPRGTSLSSQMQLPESSDSEEDSQRTDENPVANFMSGLFQPKSKRDDLQQIGTEVQIGPEGCVLQLSSPVDDSTNSHDFFPLRLEATVQETNIRAISAQIYWKDQGWGNQKGCVILKLSRNGAEIGSHVLFPTAPHSWEPMKANFDATDPDFNTNILNKLSQGDVLSVHYHVGGGGGHSLHIRTFNLTILVQEQEAQLFEVIVPEGVSPGQEFQVMAGGKLMTVVCPMNAGAGSPIRIKPPE
eukprot:CAMPEP_0117867272 /NCGR_PEP_ID=MMETSP0950-20121206/7878_1 /TAXON_ID=44440 /ORGANISM="Chattonella subsalsa, Strain CCMP2191" /LENGTH=349 /DNA_ID=CAMNT_0005718801 /DNA_START=68 /DNA_END=1117 /DNA_ORIENTATION=+